jgi:hypothetical protein
MAEGGRARNPLEAEQMIPKAAVQAKMQRCLDTLGLPIKVVWTPNRNHDKHGLIEESSRTIFLFDEGESEAWATFTHEILEFRLKDVTKTYRSIINALIEVFEQITYQNKEIFLESVPEILKAVEEAQESK